MAVLAPFFAPQFLDNSGNPLASGKLYTYVTGTTTNKQAFQDQAGTTPHSNPITLDSAGRVQPGLWLATDGEYRLRLETAASVLVDEWDDVGGQASSVDFAASTGSASVGFIQAGSGAVATTVQAKLRKFLHVEDFGAVGNGSTDDSSAIANAIAQSVSLGLELHFDGSKTYQLDAATVTFTAGARLRTNGATIRCNNSTTSNTVWLTVGSGVVIDALVLSVPTGIRRDRLVTIGANCYIGRINASSVDQQATADSDDFGVRLLGDGSHIGPITVDKYDRAVTFYQSKNFSVASVQVTNYVRGLYVFECSDYTLGPSHIRTASANASFTAGHNGLIVSNDTANASHDGRFFGLHIEDAGEHGVRVGGALTQSNLWFYGLHVHDVGGCGFKVLGTDSITPTDRNGTIWLIDPSFEDIGTGTLSDNKCAMLIMHVDRVKIQNPTVRKINNTYSSYTCLRVVATGDLSVVNPTFEDAQLDGVWLDGSESGDDNDRFTMEGGICRGNAQDGLRIATGVNTVRRFNIEGTSLDSNGRYGFNIAKGGSGTITDSQLEVKCHNNTTGPGACDASSVFMHIDGLPTGGAPISGVTAGNGSTWNDQTTLNIRKAGAWVAL